MRRSVRTSVGTAAVLLGLALGGCGTGGESGGGDEGAAEGEVQAGPGVDPDAKTITIGYIGGLTGPAAALSQPMKAGMETCWEAIDDAGGIDGWTVEFLSEDSGYETQQHVQLFNQMKDDIALLTSFGSPTTKAIQPLIEREGIVTVPQSWDSLWGADPLLAPIGTPFSIDVANGLDYVLAGGAKTLRVGAIYQDDEGGADIMRGYDAALEAYGFEDVGRHPYKPGDTDYSAQVQRLKSAKADVVLMGGVPSASGPAVGTAASIGFTPQWLFIGPAFIEQLITEDGTPGSKKTPLAGALEGTLVTMFSVPWGDEAAPGMATMIEEQERYAPDQTPSVYYTVGYTDCKVQEAILRKAIASGDLSREGIQQAKLTLGPLDLQGLAPDVEYTEEPGPPSRTSLIAEIDPDAPGFLRTVEPEYGGDAGMGIQIG